LEVALDRAHERVRGSNPRRHQRTIAASNERSELADAEHTRHDAAMIG